MCSNCRPGLGGRQPSGPHFVATRLLYTTDRFVLFQGLSCLGTSDQRQIQWECAQGSQTASTLARSTHVCEGDPKAAEQKPEDSVPALSALVLDVNRGSLQVNIVSHPATLLKSLRALAKFAIRTRMNLDDLTGPLNECKFR